MDKSKKKVVHVIVGLEDGGAEGVLYRLCLRSDQFEHVVVSMMSEGKYGAVLQQLNIKLHCLNMTRGRPSLLGGVKLMRILQEENPDVVQTWMYHADFFGGVIARIMGTPKICWGIRHTSLNRQNTKTLTIVVAKLCALLSGIIPFRIICCAKKACHEHVLFGYEEGKMIVIPNGFDVDRFSPNPEHRKETREQLDIPEKYFLIGMVARYDKLKDHSNLLNALLLLDGDGIDFKCVFVGRGMTSDNLELNTKISLCRLRSKILLLGQRTDVPNIMNALDLHVLSSMSEAFPNVVAEAMACGTPCVVTDVGDASDIVGDLGMVVPPMDSEKLYRAIKDAYDVWSSGVNDQRSVNSARRIHSNFSLEAMVRSYEGVWSD